MRFLKKFKVSEILCVTSFDTICIFSFDTKRVHHTMETPSKCNYKLHVKNARFEIINQHMNGTYDVQSSKKDFYLNTVNS
jgi:hypothetical protein